MSDHSNNTEDARKSESRFEHKSQGMRSMSQMEKQLEESAAEDKTVKIDSASLRRSDASVSNDASEWTSKPARTSHPVATGQRRSSSQTSGKRESSSASKKATTQSSYAKTASSRSKSVSQTQKSRVNADAEASKSGTAKKTDEALGISVFVNRSDIPAYELGLSSEDYYIPKEIRSGKVSKLSSEQLDELEAKAPKKRRASSSGKKKSGKKKKMTPAQKAVRACIWVGFWVIVLVIAFVCYRITYNVFYDIAVDPDSTTTIEYTVTAGATDESIYEDLSELGVMNCTEFIYKLRAKVFDAEYIEGTYTISDGYNIEKIINILAGYDYSDDD